jgi:hypothetical protein
MRTRCLSGEGSDAEVAVVAPQSFEDALVLPLRGAGEIVEVGRAEIADDHGAD